MRGIFYKEFMMSRRILFFIGSLLLISVFGGILFAEEMNTTPDDVYLIKVVMFYMPFFFASLVNGEGFRVEEKRVWCHFVISSPQAARGQILCKYLMLFVINLILFVVTLLVDLYSCKILGTMDASIWKLLLIFFFINTITNAFECPFFIRFGTTRGMNIKGAMFGIVMATLYIIFLFADMSFIREHNIFDWLLELVTTGPDLNKICIWLGVIAAVLYSVSCFISTKLYRAGIEAYEN